ncbi:MAG: hypothetical protein ACRD5H_00780 [Nitrososphaerales archaeon]
MLTVNFDTKTIEADNHILETYRMCEEKYRLMLHEHWVPSSTSPAMAFGIAMHAARARYKHLLWLDKPTTFDLDKSVNMAIEEGLRTWDHEMPIEMKTEVMQDDKRSKKNFERLARGYFAKFGGYDFEPLQVEIPGKTFLGTTPEGWQMNYIYTIDELVRYQGRIAPLEFKTTSGFAPPDERFFSGFHNKASITGYIWACEQRFGYDISEAIIHAMWVHSEPKVGSRSKYALADYFRMGSTFRNDAQIEEWKKNTLLTGDDIVRSVKENRWKRADGLPCLLYDGCTMKQVCESIPEIRDTLLNLNYKHKEWNPWLRTQEKTE